VLLAAACPGEDLPPVSSLDELNYSRRVWQSRDGLPEDFAQAVTQTADGYLWIGTSGGLVRFDGVRFTAFAPPNPKEFHDDSIYALTTTRDGALWAGAEGGGLLRYRNGAFQVYGPEQGLTNGFVRTLYEDRDGVLWIGTDKGLFRMRGNRFERVDGKDGIPALSIHSIIQDSRGRLLFGGSGILILEKRRPPLHYQSSLSHADNNVRVLLEDREGALWIGAISGLRRVSAALDDNPFLQPKLIGNVNISTLYQGEDCVWIGSYGRGLLRYKGGKMVRLAAPDALPHDNVLSIFADREHNLWVGSHGGLQRMSPSAAHTISTATGELFGINTVYQDPGGALLVASLSGRLYQVRDRLLVPYAPAPDTEALPIRNAFRSRDGSLWLGTDGHGVIRLNGGSTRFSSANGLVNDFVRAFCEDRDGSLWIGTDGGVSRWRDGKFSNFQAENGLSYGSVRALIQDRNGVVWIATDEGVSRFSKDGFLPLGPFARLRATKIWSLFEDPDGGIWLGAHGAGLFLYKDGQLSQFTAADGIPAKIHFITEDKRGDLWLTSPAGICSIARRDLERAASVVSRSLAVRIFNTSDGLSTNQMSGGVQSAGALGLDGKLWLPSARGLVMLTPGMARDASLPQVLIEQVTADDRELQPGNSGAVDVPPGRSKLELRYTAIRLQSPERLRFRYWMEGADAEWSQVGERRVAYFSHLPPASYRFHVAAFDVDDPRRAAEQVLAITLQPAFYQTGWFLSLAGLFAFGLGWAAYRMRVRAVRQRFAAVLEERNRVAREMHDTVIQGCVGVSSLLEAASSSRDQAPELSAMMIERARTEIRSTVEDARAAVWNLRHSLEGGDAVAAITRLTNRVAIESGLAVKVLTTGVPHSLGADTESGLVLSVREALRNVVRHAAAQQVTVTLSFSSRELEVAVEDDGCGFDCRDMAAGDGGGHYGLIGMRERIEKLGGRLDLNSAVGRGVRVHFTIPCGPKP
jgi:ligand-binding sensor domain-containing protein/signal transduction histidine kinase